MSYRPGHTSYLIRDPGPKKNGISHVDEEDESVRIEVDDAEREYMQIASEMRKEEEMMEGFRGYKKKYTFTQRKPATVYHCELCDKTFKHPSKIEEHLRKHTRERPYPCEVCGARFTQGGSLKVHLRAHLGELPYKCSYCDRHFATPYNQKAHEAVHVRGGRFHRDQRDRLAEKEVARQNKANESAALANQKRETEESTDQVFECGVEGCGYQHTVREAVESHVMMHHANIWDAPMEGVEGEEVIEGDDGVEYQNYAYYEYVEHETLMDEQGVVVMTEEEVAAVTAANAAAADGGMQEQQHIPSSSPSLSDRHSLQPMAPMGGGIHATIAHPSTSNGGAALMIEADEQVDEDGMRKAMTDDGRTKRLRLLTLGRTGMGGGMKDEMYPGYSTDAPLASYEVEVMTSREGNAAAAAAAAAGGMDDGLGDEQQPVFADLTRAQLIEDEMDEDEGVSDRVRILADLRPPAKGRRPTSKWENSIEGMEADVDRAFLEEVMPRQRGPRSQDRRRNRDGPPITQSRNLDWIIDAVAQGADVDQMSPHNRRKPTIHTCTYCGKTDKYPSKIQAHMRTHTGEKPFKCEFCGMGFAQKTPLRMHIRRHLNDRSFSCEHDGCGAKFISQALLNAHLSSRHSSTRRFVCMKGCGRWFANGRNQRAHEQKCHYIIKRTTVNTDYNPLEEAVYDMEGGDDGEGSYLDEDEEGVDEVDEGEYDESLHIGVHPDMEGIPPAYM